MDILSRLRKTRIWKNPFTIWIKYYLDEITGRNSLYHYGSKVERIKSLPDDQQKTFLFPTAFFLDRGLAWQTTIARSLEARGHKVIFMPLDLSFPRCNALYFDEQDAGYAMPFYQLYTNTMLRSWSFDIRPYSNFGNAHLFKEHLATLKDFDYEQCVNFKFQDLPLGEIVKNSLIHYFRCSPMSKEPYVVAAYRDYLAMGMVLVKIIEHALDTIRPTNLFVLNGTFIDSRLQFELAKKRNIPVVTFEAGFMLNSLMLGINQPIISFPMSQYLPPDYNTYKLSATQQEKLNDYLRNRSLGKDCVFDYWGKPIFDRRLIQEQIGLPDDVTPDILFTNLLWDSAMLDCDIAFDSQIDWIEKTIRWYIDHPNRTLLVRIHPAEVNPSFLASTDRIGDAISNRFPVLPKNIIVIPPTSTISSYPLAELSNLTLVYSSTAGLESAIMGKPVIVLGKTHYRRQGFTHDIEQIENYWELLLQPRLPKNQNDIVESARKYAYFFFFGFNIPFSLVRERSTSDNGPAVEYVFTSEKELLPGKNPELDFIIEVLLGEKDYRDRLLTLIS